jgi:hypothetical protein
LSTVDADGPAATREVDPDLAKRVGKVAGVSDDPWGRGLPPATLNEPPAPLPSRLADLAALTGRRPLMPGQRWQRPVPEELPEVATRVAAGWRPLEESLPWCCLPAVWPLDHRCWVPDRLPRVTASTCVGADGERHWLGPWDDEVRQADLAEQAAECGLPEPPHGRLWLLRSPWPSLGLAVVLHLLVRRCERRGLPVMTSGVMETAREVLAWPEERVWSWWTGPQAQAARAWRNRGRVGEDVADLVLCGLGPDETAMLAARLADGGAGLTEAQAVVWCRAVDETGRSAVERIVGWQRLGVPVELPHTGRGLLAEARPEQAAAWFQAGFDLTEICTLWGLPLAEAIAWRDRRFPADETRRLLQADRTLTPDEARAFDAVGIGPAERLRWVEDGFDASAARAWTDVGVLPGEARVWRSVGKGPDVAGAHTAGGGAALPPQWSGGWNAFGTDRADRRYGVTDPPGTRGRTAERAHRHNGPRRHY